jgi:CTP:molybdopterin cytidylyltransferase MocA
MVTAVVMVGESGGATEPVAWVQGARRRAARDLLEQLQRQPAVDELILVSPEADDLAAAATHFIRSQPGAIHVGRQLAQIAAEFGSRRGLLCFGGGSAPLLADDTLERLITGLAASDGLVVTNNRFASDWAGWVPATAITGLVDRLPQDNMLGWVLSSEAGLPVESLPPSAASRLDIDTPADLLVLSLHPGTRYHLRAYLEQLPLDSERLAQAVRVLATPAGRVFIAGRFGPDAWAALNRSSHCWLRVVAEERGMVSSGRLARGEVYSLLAEQITLAGMDLFFERLAQQADVAFIDSRVLLAHYGRWPSQADRFASDLGHAEQIEDAWLREFTAYARQAPLPVILGGHSLMSGAMFALCDLLW